MENLNELNVRELKELAENVKVALVARRLYEKEVANVEKDERSELFHNNLKEGDSVIFLYGRENAETAGTVVRVSDKTVTVKSDVFAKGQNYVRFDRFVEITGSIVETVADEADVEDEVIDVAI